MTGRRIPTPWRLRLSRWRVRVLPLVVFVGAAVVTGWLWRRQQVAVPFVGQVVTHTDVVHSPYDGRLVGLDSEITRNVRVAQGQLLSRFDEAELAAELEVFTAELAQRRAELEVLQLEEERVRREDELEGIDRARRVAIDLESAELRLLEARAALEVDRMERRLREDRRTRLASLVDRGLATEAELRETELRCDRIDAEIRGGEAALPTLEAQRDAARQRAQPPSLGVVLDDPATRFAPIRAELDVLRSRMAALSARRERLRVIAPRDGVVTDVFARPGQWVRAGDPLVAIHVDEPRHVVGYLVGVESPDWRAGARVELRGRSRPTESWRGRVEEVGPAYTAIPAEQLRPGAIEPALGLPVKIALPADHSLRPGELVDFRLAPE